ncbi:hypothetical protein [Vibrio metschnikovii]|uniref:hypothetical protein n=1 Tax=Vibrio metschnikovii TaxID=28172 RepID=UPI002FC581D8
MNELQILVVVYNKESFESKTLKSLVGKCNKHSIVVWNNGPNEFSRSSLQFLDDNFSNYEIKETLDNISLSKLYNYFLVKYNSHRYLILDDDSDIESYPMLCDDIMYCNVPHVVVNGDNIYPKIDREGHVTSINSGLLITNAIKKEMTEKFGNVFDENYRFYGIDSSFFKRLSLLNNNKALKVNISGVINHDLSRLSDKLFNEFKERERIIAKGISARRYFTVYKCMSFFYALIRNLSTFRFSIVGSGVIAFYKGSHPRE